tara:strand:+ start:228 stop:707 length:480 start_codon:yes stop_codon:yes gene_type:complete
MAVTYAELNDPVSTVSSLLDDNWDVAHIAGTSTKANIGDTWDLNKVNLKNNDVIRCYEVASSHDFLGVGKGVDKGTARISIDITTKVSRSRLRELYSEVVSIIRAEKAGTITVAPNAGTAMNTNYSEINLLSRVDQSDKQRRWYRYVLDCEITSYEAVV